MLRLVTFAGIWASGTSLFSVQEYSASILEVLALVLLFHSHNVLVKSFTVSVTDVAKIFWEKVQVGLRKVDFQTHIASHSFVRSQQFATLWFPKKSLEILLNDNHAFLSVSFRSLTELFVLHQFLDLGFYKYTLLVFASLTFGNLFLIYWNPRPVLSIPFTKFFLRPSFLCKCSPEEQEDDWRHFSPRASVMFV